MECDGPHPATLKAEDLLADCSLRFARRRGPGGQHRNKVETAVVIQHRPTGVVAEANERRSRQANRQMALFRLRMKLALGVRTAVDARQGPSERWRSRLRGHRLEVSPRHEDFPALLAEALDRVAAHGLEISPAAESLGISGSQLVRLLRLAPPALAEVNRQRGVEGLRPLR